MIHIIYLSIIVLMLWWLIKAYDFANRKHKELKQYKEVVKVPIEIFNSYEKAYVKFYKWLVESNVKKEIIDKFEQLFKYE